MVTLIGWGRPRGIRRRVRVPCQRPPRLPHRSEHLGGWRRGPDNPLRGASAYTAGTGSPRSGQARRDVLPRPRRPVSGLSAPRATSKPAPLRASAHQEDAGPFEGVGHLEPSCVEGPHVQALQERRDTVPSPRRCRRRRTRPAGLSSARTWPKIVLNAFTTCALVGAAAAICWDTELPSVVTSPLASALNGLVMSTRILPASASP